MAKTKKTVPTTEAAQVTNPAPSPEPQMIEFEVMKTCFVTDPKFVGGSRKVMKGDKFTAALDDEMRLLHERGWLRRTL